MRWLQLSEHNTGLIREKTIVKNTGYFSLCEKNICAELCYSSSDYKGVEHAVKALSGDIFQVTGHLPSITAQTGELPLVKNNYAIIVGTIGKCRQIDQLIEEKKLFVDDIQGVWEAYIIETIENPVDGIQKALVIAGSDKRGTIYGTYKIAEIIGVSAWVWWADSLPEKHTDLLIADGKIISKTPSVKYRGIFINDENPCFYNWCLEKFGGVNSRMYVRLFELVLRLKGNYLWPAMWGKSFNLDDPLNPFLADEYGIVMGTSHHEPMMCAQKEWAVFGEKFGGHKNWNYCKNRAGLCSFWENRIVENKNYEKIITVGMRGDGDEAMISGGSVEENIDLLQQIVSDQRSLISKHINTDSSQVPQAWCLYKEVEDFYYAGMDIPSDITLLLCDDNFGNVRTLPTKKMTSHKGGFGMYYHFDYVGSPYSYKWINNMPLQKIWEQMTMAYEYGVKNIWIVNVGDLKAMEFPTEYFLDLAYDCEKWGVLNTIEAYTFEWAVKEFGSEYAKEITELLNTYTKLNGIQKPENLNSKIFSVTNYLEADRILAIYESSAKLAEELYKKIPTKKKDSFFQLVYYPVKASYTMYCLHICVAKNNLYAKQGKKYANEFAQKANECFLTDLDLSKTYNEKIANGKWNHMMTQAHLGQTWWKSPEINILPAMEQVVPFGIAVLLVSVPDDDLVYKTGEACLPEFITSELKIQRIHIDNGGESPLFFAVHTDYPWIEIAQCKSNNPFDNAELCFVNQINCTIPVHSEIAVRINKSKLPSQKKKIFGSLLITGDTTQVTVLVQVCAIITETIPVGTFIASNGVIAIEAEHFTKNSATKKAEWKKLEQYGRTLSAMKVFPVHFQSKIPAIDSPCLEYSFYCDKSTKAKVHVISAPSNNLTKNNGMRFVLQIDSDTPVLVDTFSSELIVGESEQWKEGVMQNARVSKISVVFESARFHTLRIYHFDPGFVLQKIIIDLNNNLKSSFLGPQESFRFK